MKTNENKQNPLQVTKSTPTRKLYAKHNKHGHR